MQIEELLMLAQLVNSTNDATFITETLKGDLKLKNSLEKAWAHQTSEVGDIYNSLTVKKKFDKSKDYREMFTYFL